MEGQLTWSPMEGFLTVAAPGISWAQEIQTALNWMNNPSARLWFQALCAQGCSSDCRFSCHFCLQKSSAGLACWSCTWRKKIGKRTSQNWASLPYLSPPSSALFPLPCPLYLFKIQRRLQRICLTIYALVELGGSGKKPQLGTGSVRALAGSPGSW